jgi:PTH1 family peptidyl-tRNA hydrolase
MILLAGLGNPGLQYINTRHNAGFLSIDNIIEKYSFTKESNKFNSKIYSGSIKNHTILAVKSQNFMNLSGTAILQFKSFYKIEIEDIFIFHDEIDLKLGTHKIKTGGGSAGHNGLKDIDNKIGKNYHRIRIGVGRPDNPEFSVSDYVLGKFSSEERDILNKKITEISESLGNILL